LAVPSDPCADKNGGGVRYLHFNYARPSVAAPSPSSSWAVPGNSIGTSRSRPAKKVRRSRARRPARVNRLLAQWRIIIMMMMIIIIIIIVWRSTSCERTRARGGGGGGCTAADAVAAEWWDRRAAAAQHPTVNNEPPTGAPRCQHQSESSLIFITSLRRAPPTAHHIRVYNIII